MPGGIYHPKDINKNDEITYSHEDFMKGEFKGKGRYGSVYSVLCDVSGEIIAIKILDNVPQEKINEILFSIENTALRFSDSQ